MIKAGIDQDAIVKMFSQATTKQGEALRKAVGDATLKALQGRDLTMANILTMASWSIPALIMLSPALLSIQSNGTLHRAVIRTTACAGRH